MGGTAAANRGSSYGHARRPEDWSLEERLMALQESHGLVDEALNGWCRVRGLFAHHLVQWRADFCAGGAAASRRESAQDVRDLKQANVQLQRELKRRSRRWPKLRRYRCCKKVPRAPRGRGRMTAPEERRQRRPRATKASSFRWSS
ncbi:MULTISPECIES: hypothetical protein [unclassified Paraburkholderia]|uniref:hypothetical protein n=1 Tax=unclassified Paraburkholderia TaxID=2615204 RepID=UPI002AB308D3|nr:MULTISPECIES: hypothetical protein [unclassified Paraburkholderia]